MKFYSIFLFCLVISLSCYGEKMEYSQTSVSLELDSTLKKLQRLESLRKIDSLKIYVDDFLEQTNLDSRSIYRWWAFYYYATIHYKKKPQTCLQMTLEAHQGFIREREEIGILKTANRLGNIYARTFDDINSSSRYYQFGFERSSNTSNLTDSVACGFQAQFMNNMSINEMALGNFDQAIQFVTEAIEYANRYEDRNQKSFALMNLANINVRLKNYKKGSEVNRELLKLSQEMKRPSFISMAINNIAACFAKQNQMDSAIVYLKKSYDLSLELEDWNALALRASNLGSAHLEIKQFEIADNYLHEALGIAQKHQLSTREIFIRNSIAKSLISQQQAGKATEILISNIKKIKQVKRTPQLIKSYDLLHKAYLQQKNYQEALVYLTEMNQIKDSIKSVEVLSAAEELQTKYETEKKEKRIAQLQQEQLTQQLRFQQKLSLFGVSFFLLLITGLFLFFKNRTRLIRNQQKAIELEQRLFRSQMNPHFTFNALSSIQTYLLKSGQAQKGAYYLAKFAKLMRQILAQSQTSFITIEEEVKTLEYYLALQKLRYEASFSYEIEIAASINPESVQIPPMLIQPIIENAIEHGKIYTLEDGKVKINIFQQDQLLFVKIADNGIGRSLANTTRAKEHESIALKIIEERLTILKKKNNKKSDFKVIDPKGRGTEVLFTLPLINQYD